MSDLSNRSYADLVARFELGKTIVAKIREWRDDGDAGAQEALENYKGQLDEIRAELRRRRKQRRSEAGAEKPAATKVRAKVAKVGAKPKRR